jgi:hypothetical protein
VTAFIWRRLRSPRGGRHRTRGTQSLDRRCCRSLSSASNLQYVPSRAWQLRDGLNVKMEAPTTKAARANKRTPAIRAARCSACSDIALVRNLQSTTTVDASSIALSPPNAISAALFALQPAKSDTAAWTVIHSIVIACALRTRRRVSGAMFCSTMPF